MFKEIAAKTLTGKGRLSYFFEKELHLEDDVSKLLGCWIINLDYKEEVINKDVFLKGSYSIQLWYALNNDQKSSVYEEKIDFYEKVSMAYRDLDVLNDEMFIKVFISKYPTCVGMELDENKNIKIKIESLFYLDVFQEAILFVSCQDKGKDEISLDEELLMSINPNYLVDKK